MKKRNFKTPVIAALTFGCMITLAPVAAHANGPDPFETKVVAIDYHFSANPALYSRYNTDDKTASGLPAFLHANPCLTQASDSEKSEIVAIQKTQPYQAAWNNYQAKCGPNNPSALKFVIADSLSSDVLNRIGQQVSQASVTFYIQIGKEIIVLPISKKNPKPANSVCRINDQTCSETYAVNMADTSCSGMSNAVSDVNTGLISSQLVATLNNAANSCNATNTARNTALTSAQQEQNAAADLLGTAPAAPSTAPGNAGSGLTDNGCWGPVCSSSAGVLSR